VLDTLTESAARLCEADMAGITRQVNGGFYYATNYNFLAAGALAFHLRIDFPSRPELKALMDAATRAVQRRDGADVVRPRSQPARPLRLRPHAHSDSSNTRQPFENMPTYSISE
jgi:hypothetical protein